MMIMWIRQHTTLYKEHTMNFSNLKKSSNNFDALLKQVDKMNGGATFEKEDGADNYWKPTPDKTGNALAVIRFLPGPAVDGDDALPWVRYFDHGFQNKITGKWYIEKSLTTFDQKDPVSEYNSQLWNSSADDNGPERKQARDQKRRLHYVSNIYIVSDPKNPENEGKVFLFKYGKKIFDKIMEKLQPEFQDESPVNVFDFWKGADFKLKIRKVAGYVNYDKSEFDTPQPLMGGDDAKLEGVWKKQYSLKEFIAADKFKSYDELSTKLRGVLSGSASKKAEQMSESDFGGDSEDNTPKTSPKQSKPAKMVEKAPADEDGEEDAMSYFEKLANEE